MIMVIYTDDGAACGNRTKYYRQAVGCLEWIWLDSYMSGSDEWFKLPNLKTICEAMLNGLDIKQVR